MESEKIRHLGMLNARDRSHIVRERRCTAGTTWEKGKAETEFGKDRYCTVRKPLVFPVTSRTVGKTHVKESLNC